MELPSEPLDIQKKLDEYLASNPELQKYVTKLWYVPEGQQAPADCTHKIRLNSQRSQERAMSIGLVATPESAIALDMLLAMIATTPPPVA